MNSEFQISYAKLGNFSIIATGQSSTVQKATLTKDDSKEVEVATKTYVVVDVSEIHILANLNHKNVIKFIGAVMDHDKKILVMEYAPHGNLYDYLRKQNKRNKRLSVEHSMEWARQCSSAVDYLHSQTEAIIHCDIKSHNFLLSADLTDEKYFHVLKLCDFGISHKVKRSATSTWTKGGGLTLQWAAPEVIRKPGCCSIYSDVYSLAVVIWELFTGQRPYEGIDDVLEIQNDICSGKTPNTESISCRNVSQLLQRCWRKEKNDRPKAKEVVEELSKMDDDNDTEVDAVPGKDRFLTKKEFIKGLTSMVAKLEVGATYESVQHFKPRTSKASSPERVVTDMELQELGKYLGKNWKEFGIQLEFMLSEIDVFEINNPYNVGDAMIKMLTTWRAKFGRKATVGKLVHHLDHFEPINPECYKYLINDSMIQ